MAASRISNQKRREWRAGYLLSAPVVLGTLVFFLIPTVWSMWISFTQGTDYASTSFAGIENYVELFSSDKNFSYEVLNTLYYAFASAGISLAVSLALAVSLNRPMRFRSLCRVIYFLPSVTMAAAVGVVWRALYNSQYGLINQMLGAFGSGGIAWLTDPRFMMLGMVIVGVWSNAGYNMIILLAGLQNIPRVFYEAAQIDGASVWKQFRHVTVPMLSPVLFFVSITSLMGGFKVFDMIYTLSGAANSADRYMRFYRTMVYGIYQKGFLFSKLGLASAESMILFLMILLLTLIQFACQKKWVHYE